MPFQKGNQLAKNRKEAKGGRPSDGTQAELREAMATGWPVETRAKAIQRAAAEATNEGDMMAFKLLMSYAFGTPASGDELKIQEQVDAEIENIVATLKESISPAAWEEVRTFFGIGEDEGEEPKAR